MTYRPRWLRTRVTPQVRALRIQPGDTIVLRTERPIGPDSLKQILAQMQRAFPGHKTLVLDRMHLDVAREDHR